MQLSEYKTSFSSIFIKQIYKEEEEEEGKLLNYDKLFKNRPLLKEINKNELNTYILK